MMGAVAMDPFVVSQILSGLAFASAVTSMQCRERRTILLWLVLAAILSASHFFLLGRNSAGTLYMILCVRVLVAAYSTNPRFILLFGAAVVVGFLATYERPLDILALTASLVATYAAFQSNPRRMRIVYMCCAALWMVHNILAGSPMAVAMEVSLLISNAIGFWRHHLRTASV
ncbi:MAG: YgjV family protein [Gemmatimonadetes bacterium]|nr:YgjV family protein [Gemmatimonadota bacterium]MBT5142103.1 YgjV family protein [Gemmatimonadota bacterium]MBT5589312.1 YgjV family protein [Gemmatimonadota bacterium]MBT5963038.1 YgjV family protein [Gemmatimonadota bacterium]MBT6628558.1 YgjV family protein [Gemmatimonadota bacterium]